VQILKPVGVEQAFTVNVLESRSPPVHQGIRPIGPTIRSCMSTAEFVGGSDIMREMYQSGELQKLLACRKTTS